MADEYTEIRVEYDNESKRTFLLNGKSVGDYNFLIGHILDENTGSSASGETQRLTLAIDYDKVHFNAREQMNLIAIVDLENSLRNLRKRWNDARADITKHFKRFA